MKLEDIIDKCTEEGVFLDSAHQHNTVGNARWRVQLRANSKYEPGKAWSYFPGEGPTFEDAYTQAASNAGAISGRVSMAEDDLPKRKKRSKEDLLG